MLHKKGDSYTLGRPEAKLFTLELAKVTLFYIVQKERMSSLNSARKATQTSQGKD
jgi:hypothetical protein